MSVILSIDIIESTSV